MLCLLPQWLLRSVSVSSAWPVLYVQKSVSATQSDLSTNQHILAPYILWILPQSCCYNYIILSVFYIYNYMYCAGGVYLSSPAGVYKYHTLEVDRLSQYFHFIKLQV